MSEQQAEADKLPGNVIDRNNIAARKAAERIARLKQEAASLESELVERDIRLEQRIADDVWTVTCAAGEASEAERVMEGLIQEKDHAYSVLCQSEEILIQARTKLAAAVEEVDRQRSEVANITVAHQRAVTAVNTARERHAKDTMGLHKEIERARRRLATAMAYNPAPHAEVTEVSP